MGRDVAQATIPLVHQVCETGAEARRGSRPFLTLKWKLIEPVSFSNVHLLEPTGAVKGTDGSTHKRGNDGRLVTASPPSFPWTSDLGLPSCQRGNSATNSNSNPYCTPCRERSSHCVSVCFSLFHSRMSSADRGLSFRFSIRSVQCQFRKSVRGVSLSHPAKFCIVSSSRIQYFASVRKEIRDDVFVTHPS